MLEIARKAHPEYAEFELTYCDCLRILELANLRVGSVVTV